MKKFTKLLQRLTPLLFLSSIAISSSGQSLANYAFTTSTTGSLTDMSSGTTLLLTVAYHDDDASTVQNIGFNFVFMGSTYDRFSINSNGQMKLGNATNATAIGGGNVSSPAADIAYLMPLTGDNAVKSTGRVHYKVTGSAPNRVLTVAWDSLLVPYSSSATVTGGSMQAQLFETTGIVEYIYGPMVVQGATAQSRTIALSSSNTIFTTGNIVSITTTPTYSVGGTTYATTSFTGAANMANLYGTTNGSRRTFRFTPPPAPPTPPSNLTFTSVGTGVMTLNWTDNSNNEGGFIIQRSTDGVAYTTVANLVPNTTSTIMSGLMATTMYHWRVIAVGELGNSAFISGSQATSACPTAGTYTVGPTGDYANLTTVAAALSGCSITGAFTFELQPNYTSATEAFPITFYANAGSSATNTITIRPAASVSSTLTITGSGAGSQMFNLNGVDYLTLDGRPGGIGTTSKLTIANPSTISGILKLDNDASNNKIQYLTLQNTGATATTAAISFGNVAPVTGSDNNLIDNCTITDGATTPAVGIYALGNSTLALSNSNNTVSNCNISNFFLPGAFSAGIYVASGNTDWTITNNSLYQTAARTATGGTTHYGIYAVSSSANAFTITNNSVGGSAPLAGGTAWTMSGAFATRFVAIYTSNSTNAYSTISGNTINNIAWSSSSAAATGFGIVGGIYTDGGNANITNNTIGSSTGTNGMSVTSSTGAGASVGIGSASGGTVNITNNVISSWTLSGSVATVSQGFYGISSSAGTTVTISDNTIGSLTIANSINSNTLSTGGLGAIRGIYITGGTTSIITNNTIANLNHAFAGAATANVILGIHATSGIIRITGNTIRNLTTVASATGTTGSASIIGILNTATTAGQVISRNQVYALSNNHATAAVSVIGFHIATATTGTNEVFSNRIYNLGAISPAATIMGINVNIGLVTYKNNIIRLGYNETGAAITTSAAIFGLNELVGSAGSAYLFNTIYVGGTGVVSGAVNTFALRSTQTISARTFQNNIFANVRSNASGTGKHYAANVAGSAANPAGLTLNYNNYYANGTGGVIGLFNLIDRTTLAAWKTATGQEANGVNGDPAFAAATAATPDMHLTTGGAAGNPCDGTGLALASVTDDFEGDIRANLSPTDIGADAGNYGPTGIDVGVTTLNGPTAITTCHGVAEPVLVTLANFSSNPIDLAVNPVTIQTIVSGTTSATLTVTVNTGTIPVGLSRTVQVGTINTATTGSYTFATTTTTTGDVNAANNVHNATVAIAVPPVLTGGLTVTGNITIMNNIAYHCAGATATILTPTPVGGVLPYTYLWSTGAVTATLNVTPSVTTLYRVTVTDACGTTIVKDTTLNVVDCGYSVVRNENVSYNSIMGTGTTYTTLSSGDDGITNNIRLTGTTFKYQGKPVGGFYASSNGLMSFDTITRASYFEYGNLSTNSAPIRVLAPYFTDLVIKGHPAGNKDLSMRYKINGTLGSGTASIIIEWAEMEAFGFTPPNLNFQIILHESNNSIEFNYGNMQRYDGSANSTGRFATTLAIGLTGSTPASGTLLDRMILQRANTAFFGTTGANTLLLTPTCNSQLKFIPTATHTPIADPGAPVLNDDFAGAVLLPVNATPCTSYCGTYYSSKGATASTGTAACAAATPGTADDDVWFQFSASPTVVGHKIVVTPSLGYDVVIQVLDEALTPIQCINANGVGLTESATVNLTNNGLYYLRVYDAATGSSVSGEFAVCVSEFVPPPANDEASGAIALTIGSACNPTNSVLPSTLGATPSASVPVCSAGTPGSADDDVWYQFTTAAQAGLTYTVSATGISTYNPVLQILTGTPASLTAVACINATNNGGTETYSAVLPANAIYYVRVYHSGPGGANGNFNICVTTAPPVCPMYVGETPVNNASITSSTATLRWNASTIVSGYDVYYGTSNPATTLISANQTDTFYTTPTLNPLTVYYWRVVPRNLIAANTTCGQQTFNTNPPACIAAPSMPSEGTNVCSTVNLSWTASLGATGYDVYLDAGTSAPTTLVSANQPSITYTPTGLASGNYTWKVVPKNANGTATACTHWSFKLATPNLATRVDSSRCGTGTVTLRATATSAADVVKWYSAATGGVHLGTGASFTTPNISTTTTFYAGVTASDSIIKTIGLISDVAANLSSFSNYGQYFASADEVMIDAVDIYPAAAGNLKIQLKNTAGAVVDSVIVAINASEISTTVKKTVPLRFTIPAGSVGWQLYNVEAINRGAGTYNYPYSVTGSNFRITGNTNDGNNITGGTRMYFYNWVIGQRCNSPRLPVVATVTAPPALTLSAPSTTICAGVTSNAIQVTTPVADFDTYTWSPATNVTGTTSAQFNPTQSGVYTLLATNNTTRCANTATLNVVVNPLPLAPVTGLATPEICIGNAQTLESRPEPATGVIGTGVVANTGSTPYRGFYGGIKNQYLITAAELTAMGCIPNSSITGLGMSIAAFTSPYTFNGFTIALKNTTTTQLTTTIETGVTTVLPAASYTLTGTAPFNTNHAFTTPFTWDGTSNLLVETCFVNGDAGGVIGNSASVNSTSTGTNLYTAYYSVDNSTTVCSAPGVATTTTVRPNITLNYTKAATPYTWAPLANLFTDAAATTAYTGAPVLRVYAKPTTTSTYAANIADANGCTNNSSQTVVVQALPTATFTGITNICSGESTAVTANSSATGSTYAWSTGANTATAAISTAGTYQVTITSPAGCVGNASVTVNTATRPTAAVTNTRPTTFCAGDSTVLTATGGATYAWSTGATGASVTARTSGTYKVTVTNAAGCVDSTMVMVTANARPTAAIANNRPLAFCSGDSTVLTASGVGTYAWSTGAASADITARTSGTYKVTVTNAAGCVDSSMVTVTANARPTAGIANNRPTTFCAGDSSVLTASGVGTYLWSTGATSTAITARTAGTYKVTVTSGAGCTDSAMVAITVNARPTAAIANNRPTTFCAGDSTILTASGGGTYAWSTGVASAAITARTTGSYKVVVTNASGCVDSTTVAVTANARPTAAITGATTICTGDSSIFTATGGGTYAWSTAATSAGITVRNAGTYKVTVTNAAGCVDSTTRTLVVNTRPTAILTIAGSATFCTGDSAVLTASGGATYRWSTPSGAPTNTMVTAKVGGVYKVLVFNAAGCADSSTVTITVNPKPTVSFTSSSAGGNATFTNTSIGGNTYLWRFSDTTLVSTTMNTTRTYRANGSYTAKLIVTSAAGCRDSVTNTIVITRVANEDILTGLKANVYPNPTARNLYIEFQTTTIQFGTADYISVTDAFGREVSRQAIGGNVVELNTENWASGLYMINAVISNQKVGLSKVVKIDK